MSRMKTRCVQGDILVHTGWRHHRHHAIIKRHASLSGSSRRHPTRHKCFLCVSFLTFQTLYTDRDHACMRNHVYTCHLTPIRYCSMQTPCQTTIRGLLYSQPSPHTQPTAGPTEPRDSPIIMGTCLHAESCAYLPSLLYPIRY